MRKRMMAAVPEATVVITNPTHFAVALKYERGMNAPVCVAKGMDAIALKIREVAEEQRVPMVENPPLARALHATVEIDQRNPGRALPGGGGGHRLRHAAEPRRPARAEPTVVEGISAAIDARGGAKFALRAARNRIDRNIMAQQQARGESGGRRSTAPAPANTAAASALSC